MVTVITGGCGFIGSALVRGVLSHSCKNDKIILLDSLQRHGLNEDVKKIIAHSNVTFHQMDLADREELFQLQIPVDRLYHIAAVIGVERSSQHPVLVLKVNTFSTMNVFEWFDKYKTPGARILFSSSSEVYAGGIEVGLDIPVPTPENVPLAISDISNPRFSYAVSKLWGEAWTNAWVHEKNVFALGVRYHNIYGPNMGFDHVIPQVVGRIKTRENPFRIIGANQTRSFCWVHDAVEATRQVMESDKTLPGMVVHIGNQTGEISIKELYEEMFNACEWRPTEVDYIDAPPGSVPRRCPQTGLLQRITGFQKWTSLSTGIKRTVDWYLKKYN